MADNIGRCVVKKMKLVDLKPAEYNPRKISEKAYAGLGKSIDHFGMLVPIVWNKQTGNIVGGHQRYKHLVEKGETETDVVVVDIDGNEEIALNVTLNNPRIRGRFTSDVTRLLQLSEAQIGSMFKEICLQDLFDSLKFDSKKTSTKETSVSTGQGNSDNTPLQGDTTSKDGEAVIVCPECKSKWIMRNNKILYNAVAKGASGE